DPGHPRGDAQRRRNRTPDAADARRGSAAVRDQAGARARAPQNRRRDRRLTVESPVVTEPHIRLLIVDDHPAVRKGLTSLLNNEPDMEVIAAVGSGEEAVAAARTTTPDVVLMDVSMPGMGGIEA